MPRFYFNLRNDVNVDDQEGAELPDLKSARAYAIVNARAIAADNVLKGNLNLAHYIEIVNEQGHAVAQVTFRDAVNVQV